MKKILSVLKKSLIESFETWKEFVYDIFHPGRHLTDWNRTHILLKCFYPIMIVPMLLFMAIIFVFLYPPIAFFYDLLHFYKEKQNEKT